MASNTTNTPSEPPPPYTAATTSTSTPSQSPSHLQIPHKTRSGIPPHARRSMEDESRELPTGWIRQYDPQTHHQFFVDTTRDPPHSIWHHPYDDSAFLSSISGSERERIQALHRVPTNADIEAESSEDDSHPQQGRKEEGLSGTQKLGRRVKDKLTNSTHEEREAARRRREEEERRLYQQHQHIRRQMSLAAETGQPQLLGKDKDGKEVYIEPPVDYGYGGRGGGMGGRIGGPLGAGGRAYGYNPYGQGMYGNPNARYIRPEGPYGRPYGGGYGGGYGLPIGMGLGGGLLMGSLLF